MGKYLTKRILLGLLVLLGSTFIVYALLNFAVDPLATLRSSNDPNKFELIQARTQMLDLDTPWFFRYFKWLFGVAGFIIGKGTLGISITNNQPVVALLGSNIATTLQLVFGAMILAIVFGIIIGIITALKQYSAFDYLTTLLTFLFYSLPAFWVAVLLKEFLALKFNAFLKNPILSLLTIIIVACVIGILCFLLSVGKLQKRLIICGAGIIISIIILFYISFSKWFSNPYFGYIGSVIIIGGLGFGILTIMAGNENKKANLSALTFFIVLIVGYMPLQYIFVEVNSLLAYVLVAVIVILIGVLIGFLYGGDDKNISMKTNGVIGFVAMLVLFVDQLFQYWSEYYKFTNGNPIATISQSTPNFAGAGNFWLTTMDTFTHSVLPTIALLLISFAAYTRYTRSSMLDVMNQDYIRTARAKGLNERTVIFRHAFRNALLPLATIVPLDLAGILGGAIITEKVFGWHGMGTMFLDSVSTGDFNGVMGYFLVIAVFAIIATIVADILYAILDPRIRIDS